MTNSRFSPDNTGICLATLASRSAEMDERQLEELLRACETSDFRALALNPAWAGVIGIPQLQQRLATHALNVRVMEAIVGWSDGATPAAREAAETADLAESLDADLLMAATIAPDIDWYQAVAGFAVACDIAAGRGLKVALEFIPGTAVPDLATAWHLVRDSGADNAGLVIDCLHWHHQPDRPGLEALQQIPPERILYVQLCDSPDVATPAAEDYIPFAMSDRAVPGEGVADVAGLLSAIAQTGADPFYAFEVFNTSLAASGPDAMAQRLRRSLDRVMV